eukprot:EG_transcript_9724
MFLEGCPTTPTVAKGVPPSPTPCSLTPRRAKGVRHEEEPQNLQIPGNHLFSTLSVGEDPRVRQALVTAWQLHHDNAELQEEIGRLRQAAATVAQRDRERQRRMSVELTKRGDQQWAAAQRLGGVAQHLHTLLALMADVLPLDAAERRAFAASLPRPVDEAGHADVDPEAEPGEPTLMALAEACGVLVERGLEVLSLAYDRRCAELAAASPLKQTLVARPHHDVAVQVGSGASGVGRPASVGTHAAEQASLAAAACHTDMYGTEYAQRERRRSQDLLAAVRTLETQLQEALRDRADLEGEVHAAWCEARELRQQRHAAEQRVLGLTRERWQHCGEVQRLSRQCEALAEETQRIQGQLSAAYDRKLASYQRKVTRLTEQLDQERRQREELLCLPPDPRPTATPPLARPGPGEHTEAEAVGAKGRLAFLLNSRPFIVRAVWTAYGMARQLRGAVDPQRVNAVMDRQSRALEAELRWAVSEFFTEDEKRHLDVPVACRRGKAVPHGGPPSLAGSPPPSRGSLRSSQ